MRAYQAVSICVIGVPERGKKEGKLEKKLRNNDCKCFRFDEHLYTH